MMCQIDLDVIKLLETNDVRLEKPNGYMTGTSHCGVLFIPVENSAHVSLIESAM